MSKFIDRDRELALLNKRYGSGKAELVFIYGRRRVGKTRLVKEFLKGKRGVYLLAKQTSVKENLTSFSRRISEALGDELLKLSPLQSWDALFHYMSRDDRIVFVIDEFPYLVELDPSLPSVLQYHWDEHMSSSKVFLILTGSTVSLMEELMGPKSPLYGRRTGQIKVNPLDYFQARLFFSKYGTEDAVRAYSILGGTPAYLNLFRDSISLRENLINNLRADSLLYSDAMFLLREEVREPHNYMAVLEAVASGYNRFGQIADVTGLGRSSLGKYLSVLQELGFLERLTPIGSRKRGIYRIRDPYLRFWFRFIYPNQDLVEYGEVDRLVDLILKELDTYVGEVFEDVVAQLLRRMNYLGELPFRFSSLGKWWHGDKEFDLVALGKGKALIVEVKWSELKARDVERVLGRLRERVKGTPFQDRELHFLVVGRKAPPPAISFEEWDLRLSFRGVS